MRISNPDFNEYNRPPGGTLGVAQGVKAKRDVHLFLLLYVCMKKDNGFKIKKKLYRFLYLEKLFEVVREDFQ